MKINFGIYLKKTASVLCKKLTRTPRIYTCERRKDELGWGSRVTRIERAEGQKWGRTGDAVSVSTLRNEGSQRNGPITYSCAPKWFQPCNRPVQYGASRSYTRLWIKTSVCYPCGRDASPFTDRDLCDRHYMKQGPQAKCRYFLSALPGIQILG